jgi:hypothetical protein
MMTPLPHDNRPGLDALRYRIGAHGDFVETMLARLSSRDKRFQALNGLRTRDLDDPTIALIDAYASVLDVLTFYQERIANEGYLRTATERRSLEELAKLAGYGLRPGVAASTCLAFTLDPDSSVTIPAGARAQSVPGPGEKAQNFETGVDLVASGAWNAMIPRRTEPAAARHDLTQLTVAGVDSGLKRNDPILLVVNGTPSLSKVVDAKIDFARKRTILSLRPAQQKSDLVSTQNVVAAPPATIPPITQQIETNVANLATQAAKPPANHPPSAQALTRTADQILRAGAETTLALAAGATPQQRAAVFRALANVPLTPTQPASLEAHRFRIKSAPFGASAPPQIVTDASGHILSPKEWELSAPIYGPLLRFSIDITSASAADFRAFAERLRVEATSGGETTEIVSTIAFDDGEAILALPLSADSGPKLGTLSGTGGAVTAALKVTRGATLELVLTYVFIDQALKITVTLTSGATPQASVEAVSTADGRVAARANFDARDKLVGVLGSLEKLTGETPTESPQILYLDGPFETVAPGGWVAFDAPFDPQKPPQPPARVVATHVVNRVAYGKTAASTRLDLSPDQSWMADRKDFTRTVRETAVYADSVPLELVGEDILADVAHTKDEPPVLELDGLVTGLAVGRWLIVSGERTDLPGVVGSELVMLSDVTLGGDGDGAGETPRTTLTFADRLEYAYKRDTTSVFGNVTLATHGERCEEILGSGSGALAHQSFTLKKSPLTHVPATAPSGVISTLRIFVNNVLWKEADTLVGAAPNARAYTTSQNRDGATTVRFGDGTYGARLPTGIENVRARYRAGLGLSGNVAPNSITTLLTRPLGLKSVTNPIAATGGADAENIEDARRNIPVGMVALQRLVSVADYADFCRAFGGISKAASALFEGEDGPLVHVTLAGQKDAALSSADALLVSLQESLFRFGDPALEVRIAPRAARLAAMRAAVAVDPDRLWSDVEPAVRVALRAAFCFDGRDLEQPLYASEVIAAIQSVAGVAYVELQHLASVPLPTTAQAVRDAIAGAGVADLPAASARTASATRGDGREILPAEIVYLSDAFPDLLTLIELKS